MQKWDLWYSIIFQQYFHLEIVNKTALPFLGKNSCLCNSVWPVKSKVIMHVENQLLAQESISSEGLNLHKWRLCSNEGTTDKKFKAFFSTNPRLFW